MSDEEKRLTEEAEIPSPAEAPKPAQKEQKALNDQKKNALLRYMAVLFGVAFLLVALSFLIQIRDSSVTINQLNQSNASALQNAEKLQLDNRDLTAENKRLNQELHDTLTALDEATDRLDDAEETIDEMTTAAEAAAKLDAARQKNAEALAAAASARLDDNKETCRAALAQVDAKAAPLGTAEMALLETLTAWLAR